MRRQAPPLLEPRKAQAVAAEVPPATKVKRKLLGVYLPPEMIRQVKTRALQTDGLSASAIVEQALREFLAKGD